MLVDDKQPPFHLYDRAGTALVNPKEHSHFVRSLELTTRGWPGWKQAS
jgi:hypothetical protein